MVKLKAFTILELLVAMVISSLAIGASYLTYDIIYKQFLNFKQVDRNVLEAITFRNVLNNDMANGEFIYKGNNGVRIVNFEGKEYVYTLGKDWIVRDTGGMRDTFNLTTASVKYHEMEVASTATGLLDKLEIVIIVNGTENRLSFLKQYGADKLMLAEGAIER